MALLHAGSMCTADYKGLYDNRLRTQRIVPWLCGNEHGKTIIPPYQYFFFNSECPMSLYVTLRHLRKGCARQPKGNLVLKYKIITRDK